MSNASRLITFCAAACVSLFSGADWSRFRGPDGSAVSSATDLPLSWSDDKNIAWKVELPGPGSSSPIVGDGRVFVTCYSGYGADPEKLGDQQELVRHLICVDAQDGRILWDKKVPAVLPEDPFEGMLRQHGYASHTPVTDGEQVFVFFGKSGVVAFDRDGNQLWQTSVGTGSAALGFGSGASLVLHKDLVIVNANAESQALIALDKASGREVWRAEAQGYNGSWSTPIFVDVGGKTELVVNMPGEVWGMDPSDGGLLWYCEVSRGSGNTSLAAKDGIVYSLSGGPGGSGVVAVRAGGRDDVTKSHVVWKKSIGSYVPSPVVVGDYLYWVDDRGLAYCLKADSGEQVYRERLPGAGGVYASLTAAGGNLYAVSRGKGTFVLPAKPEFKMLAHNEIKSDTSDFNASPAISGNRLLLRSNRFLYCVGGQ